MKIESRHVGDLRYLPLVIIMAVLAVLLYFNGVAEVPVRPRLGLSDFAGKELVVVWIGSANCGGSLRDELPRLWATALDSIKNKAARRNLKVTTSGIAVDYSIDQGLDFLNRFDGLEQVSSGHSWLNEVAIKYLWRDVPGPAGIPQLIVLLREIDIAEANVSVSHEILVARIIGALELDRWVQLGAPLAIPRNAEAVGE